MRFHVVGVGAVGSLLSFHIKRTARLIADNAQQLRFLPNQAAVRQLPSPYELGVALRLRRSSFVKAAQERAQSSIVVERDGLRQREDGFGIQWTGSFDQLSSAFAPPPPEWMPGISVCEQMGYQPGTIDALLVATKAQNTVAALEPLVPSISPASTLILMQNGQGVLDQIVEQLFPDPRRRPNFILATNTHEAWMKGKLHTVHSAPGRIELGVVPNMHIGRDYERLWSASAPSSEEHGLSREEEDGFMSNPRAMDVTTESSGYDRFAPRSKRSLRRSNRLDALNAEIPLTPVLDLDAIPFNERSRTLISAMAMMLNLPLNVTWHPIRRYQMLALRRLVVAACIEPLTALVGCRNGDLFGNRHADNAMGDICREASQVLEKLAERARNDAWQRQQQAVALQGGDEQEELLRDLGIGVRDFLFAPDTLIGETNLPEEAILDPSLRPGALLDEVRRTVRLTAPHYSAMYHDLHTNRNRSTTEVSYINGYLGRLGRSLGIATPVNDTMTSMIQLKSSRSYASAWPSG